MKNRHPRISGLGGNDRGRPQRSRRREPVQRIAIFWESNPNAFAAPQEAIRATFVFSVKNSVCSVVKKLFPF